MKKTTILLIITIIFSACTKPLTKFPEEALNDQMISLNNDFILFKDILKQYEGKQIFIDVWASWCGDCIQGMPKVRMLQEQFPETVFVFLSADRSLEGLKKGIQRYQVNGEHYFMPKGMKSTFSKSVSVSWIPRYMVVDSQGNIELFKAVKADNEKLIKALQ